MLITWSGRETGASYDSRGFTIVEMLIATTVFSVIVLVASATVVRFTNNFQRGLTATTTQNTARSIIDEISQMLQVQGAGYAPISTDDSGAQGFCIDGIRYSYVLGRQLGEGPGTAPHAFIKDIVGGSCADPGEAPKAQNITTASVDGIELLGMNMRLARMDISQQGDVFSVNIKIAYGDDDLLCSREIGGSCEVGADVLNVASLTATQLAGLQCRADVGSQFCAISELSTTVQSRL